MRKIILLSLLSTYLQLLIAQVPTSSSIQSKLESFSKNNAQSSTISLEIRNIGPTTMSGRVVDVAVNDQNPTEFYAAFASGGLWYTHSNGANFSPIFDNQATMTIGDIAVNWQISHQIWVGTGENNSSRSSYAGTGIYYSNDKGKTWQHRGLTETHHIGRIVLHPQDTNTLWVAAIGHLYSPNKERGVFKTTDGGKTWQQTLYINDSTGAIDLVIDAHNPNILYASTWTRTRKANHFNGCGEGSGIYKSVDGGNTWQLLTQTDAGFPTGKNIGRIGLAISAQNSEVLYAIVDNQNHQTEIKQDKTENPKPELTKEMLKTMDKAAFLALGEEKVGKFLSYYEFPEKYTAKKVKDWVAQEKIKPIALVDYLADADNDLFDTPIIGAEVYRSDDGGKHWNRTHEEYIDEFYYTYGYYFGQIRISPFDDDEIYILGTSPLYSNDGGNHFETLMKENVHADNHALWLSSKQRGHFLLGNDGGLNLTYNNGKDYFKLNSIPVGQFYAITIDSMKPYNVYGGLQDNGVWKGSSQSKVNKEYEDSGHAPFTSIMGGDGMQVQVSNDNIVYTGYQFGNYSKIENGDYKSINPEIELGDAALRFNWQTPILLSRFNNDILYMGAQRLFVSMNQGKTFTAISPDLTTNTKQGNVPYNTITCITESPFKFGTLCIGTDDGKVQLTQDNGNTWQDISPLPSNYWVSRVIFSQHQPERMYVTLNGYRFDDFTPLIYVTENQGKTWTKLSDNLPLQSVNVIREDNTNENILYVGTDNGLFVSLDKGKSYICLNNSNLPNVAIHDLIVHPKAKELIIGTHGRSIYIADIQYLQQLTPEILNTSLSTFPLDTLTYNEDWGKKEFGWTYSDTPSIKLHFYQKEKNNTTISIQTEKGTICNQFILKDIKGVTTFAYNLTITPNKTSALEKELGKTLKKADNEHYYLPVGNYKIVITTPNSEKKLPLIIKAKKDKKEQKAGERD